MTSLIASSSSICSMCCACKTCAIVALLLVTRLIGDRNRVRTELSLCLGRSARQEKIADREPRRIAWWPLALPRRIAGAERLRRAVADPEQHLADDERPDGSEPLAVLDHRRLLH